MRKKTLAIMAAALFIIGLAGCQQRKEPAPEPDEAELFREGLTAQDTVQMLDVCNRCMEMLKQGQTEEALKALYVVNEDGNVSPLPEDKMQELRKMFQLFPVVDYKLRSFAFNDSGLNDVKYEVQFFAKEEGDSTPNTIAFMFNPVKCDGQWYATVKRADQKVVGSN